MNRIIKPCPFCGSNALVRMHDGCAIVECSEKCEIRTKSVIETDQHYRFTLENIEKAFDNAIEDWNTRHIGTEKKEIINDVVEIVCEHGQADKRFKIGETIKYSPTEIEKILCEEWGVKFE